MSLLRTIKVQIESNLAERSGIPLATFIENKVPQLDEMRPPGESPSYIAVQPDGSTVSVELPRDVKNEDISDELAVRHDNGDFYADRLQDRATNTIEEISRKNIDIMDVMDANRDTREKRETLLENTGDYHVLRQEARRNMLMFALLGVGEIGAMFFPFADIFGLDPSKLNTELAKNPLAMLFTVFFTMSYFASSLRLAELSLDANRTIVWKAALVVLSILVSLLRTTLRTGPDDSILTVILFTIFYSVIGVLLPLSAAGYFKNWREANSYTAGVDGTMRRLSEIDTANRIRLRNTNQERLNLIRELNEITTEYVNHYQRALQSREANRQAWLNHDRFIPARLAEYRLAYLFWQGHKSRRTRTAKHNIKKMPIVTGTILIVVITLLGYLSISAAETKYNLIGVCDRSSSAEEFSCNKDTISGAAKMWLSKADAAGGGVFELIQIGDSFQTSPVMFSTTYPERFSGPVSINKRKWQADFMLKIKEVTNNLPKRQGSAISEAIFRSSLRIQSDGQTVLLIMSDLREVNDRFNFEWAVPTKKEFHKWLDARNIVPKFPRSTTIVVCGAHPYRPNSDTSPVTTQNYAQTIEVWKSVFQKWGVKASIGEACNFNN